MSLTIWKIKDLELEYNNADYEQAEKLKACLDKMTEDEKALKKDGPMGEFLRGYCKMYYNLFKNMFGEDVANKLAKRSDSAEWENVYIDFLNFITAQNADAEARRATIIAKAKEEKMKNGNRQQRRNAQKKHVKHYN